MKGTTQNVDMEWKTRWSQTSLGTIKSEGNHQKRLILNRKHLGTKQHWEPETVKEPPKMLILVENTLEQNYTGDHKKGTNQIVDSEQGAH